jgi:hypothetical protein
MAIKPMEEQITPTCNWCQETNFELKYSLSMGQPEGIETIWRLLKCKGCGQLKLFSYETTREEK